jgi:hypothetical protein
MKKKGLDGDGNFWILQLLCGILTDRIHVRTGREMRNTYCLDVCTYCEYGLVTTCHCIAKL